MKTNDEIYRRTIEVIDDYSILILDEKGNVMSWNKGVEKIQGYKAEEIIGKNFSLLYTPEDRNKKLPEKLIEKATLEGKARDKGWRMKKDGTRFWSNIIITAVHDESNKVVGFSQIMRDLTEKRKQEQAQNAIWQTRDGLLKLFNASPSGMALMDIESRKFIEVNKNFQVIFEYPREEAIGVTADALGLMSTESRTELTSKMTQQGYLKNEMASCRTKGGSKLDCIVSADQFEVEGKKYFLSVFHDLTEKKTMERKMIESENNYRKIIEDAGDVLYTTDALGLFTFVNQRALKLTEYSTEELMGKHFSVLIAPEWKERVGQHYLEQFQNKTSETVMEFMIRTKNGHEKWVEQVVVMQVEANFVKGFHCIVRDITERKKATLLLKEQDEQIRKLAEFQNIILNGTDYSIITTSTTGIITSFNKGAEKMLGYRAEEVIGIVSPEIIHDKSEVEKRAGELSEELHMVIEPGIDTFHVKARLNHIIDTHEWTYICKDGTRIIVELSISALRDKEQNVIGYLGMAKDITRQREAEKELRQAKLKAEESVILTETFLANMSHEIRTPMNAIIGFTDLLLKRNLPDTEKDYIRTVKVSGENLLRIINDILDISKIESGAMVFESHPMNIKEFFTSMNIMLSQKATEKGLYLSFDCDSNLPDKVNGDPTRLTQIIINLVGNAIKFTSKGGVAVFAKLLKEEEQTCQIEFSVKDTGIGIPEDKQKQIFERFRQAETHTTRYYGGTGLGLSIAKQLVELQGGDISISSVVGEGSVFSFRLSFQKTNESVTIKNENAGKKFDIHQLAQFDILLVEDNPINVKFIESLFSEYNIKADVAENGKIAIEKVSDKKYDIILMDIEMPVMNGYETTSAMRDKLKISTPIIAMTAHAMAGEKEKCLTRGMNDYISKPINTDALLEKMFGVLATKMKNDQDQPPVKKKKIINLEYLSISMNGKKDPIREIIDIFLKQIPLDLTELNTALDTTNYLTVKQVSHRLKSTISMMGISEIKKILEEMEALAVSGKDIERIKDLNNSLNLLSKQAIQELELERALYV